ncbi:cytochrome c oxidase assembly protein subunit 19 [Sarotherodon galilaeus]
MGNAPSESNMGSNLRCCKCSNVLPPCMSFNNLSQNTLYGRYVYVFNGGQYYRPVGQDNMYECRSCFDQWGRSEAERPERQRREEEQRREQERREEDKRRKKLNETLESYYQRAKEQFEKQVRRYISQECESKRDVLIKHLHKFEANYESISDSDEFLEILSVKCSLPVTNLSLSQLTADQLSEILSVLDKLLFDEWITAPPSISTLQHTQVFITELCALSLEISEEVSLQTISNHMQSFLGSISQSASGVFESLLLTQALYLNLMQFFRDGSRSDNDAVLIAKQWAEYEISTENLFIIEFLSTLTSSLQSAVGRASVFTLKMEIQCLKLLLSTLTHQHGKEAHSESTEMLLKLVQRNQWTPMEALTLLKALSQKYADDDSITEILSLVQVYDIPPDWIDDSGRSLIQLLESAAPERFCQDFQKTLRGNDESSVTAVLAEVKMLWNLDDSVIDMIKNINTGVLKYTENVPKEEPFMKDSFKCESLNADNIQKCLCQLCKAVLNIKGWWPTVRQVVRWCGLVLTQQTGVVQLVGVEEDPCVTAIFAAMQVCMGNKLDIVLSSDVHSEEQTKEWSDFYKHLDISLNTNMKKTDPSFQDVYEADIVYGTMDDFVSDYVQRGIEAMETGHTQFSRGFIIEKQSLSALHALELSRLKDDDSLVFAAEVLQNLMTKFHSEDVELRHMFFKALFQVLHCNLNEDTITDTKIITISKKITGKELLSNEIFILTFLENLLQVFARETEAVKNMTDPAGKWCLESLFACVEQFQDLDKETKEVFKMVSDLGEQRIWSPVEALNLLGALTNNHHDDGCISIMKILHLMEIYQVSSKWKDENKKSFLELLESSKTQNLIQHLEKSLRGEKTKSIDNLFCEIRQMKVIDEQTLSKTYDIVAHVTDLIEKGNIKKHTCDVEHVRSLCQSKEIEDLQEILAVLCNAVHLHTAERKWFPRTTQMISWCLLALSDTGKLLEMGTGEGKSCVIAMFAVLCVLRGEKVDVVSSSSVLCQRDAEEWAKFYKYFGITVDTNTNKNEDKDRKECYQKDVVYGTIEAFAADHLRQIFEMKDVRADRNFQCIIIDEVDSLLLDQGVQLTYLSSPMVSMQHLNIILTMIWSHVSQYGFLSTGHQTFVRGPPASFFKAIYDSMNTEDTEISDAMDILGIAEESNIVPKGFTEDMYKSENHEILSKLKTVSQDSMVDFFKEIEDYVPYGFTVYTLDDKGLLCLQKCSPYNEWDIPELSFLVLEEGLCCPLYESEEALIKPIAELISERIQYTPCENNKDKISIPGFLKTLVEKKVSVWVQNAFLAMLLKQGREYVVENDNVCPVDFRSTGIVELKKKWGDGLQQFVEIKHQVKLSTISTVTNYISNVSFFEKYQGKIYGTTGTLGSKADIQFLQDLYPNLSVCKMPTFNRKKLFEVKGTLKKTAEEWKSEITHVVMAQISPNSYRDGRATLVICETINTAEEIYEELKSSIPSKKVILYCRSDRDSLSKIDKELLPGDVIVATNLAGRGTDIKVSREVNNNGGLFVILSFLSENTRVELQAFGRTARKGKPGSAQIIISTDHLQPSFHTVSSLEEAKSTRDRLAAEKISHMMNDVAEMKLREDLFSEHCETLLDIYNTTDGDEERAVVDMMNEFWGIWLQTKSEETDQLKRNELQESLKADLSKAKSQSESQTSPCSSIYHYIKFGNIALDEKKWDTAAIMFEKAMKQDESWAAVAFYTRAYCTIQQAEGDYLTEAIDDLMKAQESLKFLSEESVVCLQFVTMSSANSVNSNPTSLEKQLSTKCNVLSYFDKNITEAIQKLDEIKQQKRNPVVKKSPIFCLVSGADKDLQVEVYTLYNRGLKYIFSVEDEPRFSWEGLLVTFFAVLQNIGGALLTACLFRTLAQVGMGLITEEKTDSTSESMVTGEFSWKSWAIEKAISLGVSLVGFGVGKLIAKSFKSSEILFKGMGKKMKPMPKFLSRQAEENVSAVTNMKNAEMAIIKNGFGNKEEKILADVVNSIKSDLKERIVPSVESNMEKDPLATLVDFIILSQPEDKKQLQDLLKDESTKNNLLAIFKELSKTAVQPFYADLSWQNKLNSSLSKITEKAKSHTKENASAILTTIQTRYMGRLADNTISTVLSLPYKFFSNLHEELKIFKEKQGKLENVKVSDLSAEDIKLLKDFKHTLAGTISTLLADALVEVFHHRFSTYIVSHVHGQMKSNIDHYIMVNSLKSDRTEEKLRAGQNNIYVSRKLNSKHKLKAEAGQRSRSHAEKIKNSTTAGTILDIKVLSEATGTKVVILTEDSNGRLTKMQELSPDTRPANTTVTLIYRPDIESEGKSCLFHALARGMKPEGSSAEIALEADRLRSVEADALLSNPGQWEPFLKHKELTEAIRGGDWYVAEVAAPKKAIKESKKLHQEEFGKVELYQEWQKYTKKNKEHNPQRPLLNSNNN